MLFAQGIVMDYDKDKGQARCDIKADLMKAYDLVGNLVYSVLLLLRLHQCLCRGSGHALLPLHSSGLLMVA